MTTTWTRKPTCLHIKIIYPFTNCYGFNLKCPQGHVINSWWAACVPMGKWVQPLEGGISLEELSYCEWTHEGDIGIWVHFFHSFSFTSSFQAVMTYVASSATYSYYMRFCLTTFLKAVMIADNKLKCLKLWVNHFLLYCFSELFLSQLWKASARCN
jgi:hypothetical protein